MTVKVYNNYETSGYYVQGVQHDPDYDVVHDAATGVHNIAVGAENHLFSDTFRVERSCLLFEQDADKIPTGSTILSVVVNIKNLILTFDQSPGWYLRLVSGIGVTYTTTDYAVLHNKITAFGSLSDSLIPLVYGDVDILLNGLGVADIQSQIASSPIFILLGLRISTDISDSEPTSLNSFGIGSPTQTTITITYSTNPTPTITTQACSNIVTTTATGHGTITSIGGSAVTEYGHCWAATKNPTTADDKTTHGAGGLGSFTSDITGLIEGQQYFVRAYATNGGGTGYGGNVRFVAGDPSSQLQPREICIIDTTLRYTGEDGIEYYVQGVEL